MESSKFRSAKTISFKSFLDLKAEVKKKACADFMDRLPSWEDQKNLICFNCLARRLGVKTVDLQEFKNLRIIFLRARGYIEVFNTEEKLEHFENVLPPILEKKAPSLKRVFQISNPMPFSLEDNSFLVKNPVPLQVSREINDIPDLLLTERPPT